MSLTFGLSSGSVGPEQSAFQSLSNIFSSGWVIGPEDWEDASAPKAYLNYILFDENFVPYDMGWDQISKDAQATAANPNVAHDYMMLQAVARKPGYLYIYFSNEDDEIIEVYFDDLNIKHRHSAVIQVDDYYPFGLVFNSYRKESLVNQNFRYNGIEKMDDLDLDISQSFFRMHDAALGRWWQLDPKPREDVSLYSAMGNNPVSYSDPLGDTTRVYSTSGKFLYSVDVKEEENQAHFVSGKYEKRIQGKNESNAAYSKRVRGGSVAFIGKNTIKNMQDIVRKAGNLPGGGKEIAFVGVISDSKEIQLKMMPVDEYNHFDKVSIQEQLDKNYSSQQQSSLFLFGHVHHKGLEKIFSSPDMAMDLGTPSIDLRSGKYSDYFKRLRGADDYIRHSPAMIATPYGYSLYPTIGLREYDRPNPSDLSREKYSFFKAGKVK